MLDFAQTVTHISLCSGYGGIDLGLKRAIPNLRTIAYSEIEGFAVANLVSKMEKGFLDPAPVWTNLKTFPWRKFRGCVDILSGGYPCQPFSAAGKRLGKEDDRHLWPFIATGISVCRPRVCFFENVEGHITLGLSTVVSDLEELGYKVSWGIFSASEVGAPHQRKRVFLLAYGEQSGLEGHPGDVSDWCQSGWLAQKKGGSTGQSSLWRRVSFAGDCIDPDGDEPGWECSVCGEDYIACGCPGPTHDGYEYREISGELFARRIQLWPSRPGESQFCWEPPRTFESKMDRGSHGPAGGLGNADLYISCDNRTDELRLLGNGVVPHVAEKAFMTLIGEQKNA